MLGFSRPQGAPGAASSASRRLRELVFGLLKHLVHVRFQVRLGKGRRRRPVEVARSASVSRMRAARALPIEVIIKQKTGQEKHRQSKVVSFPGSFVRSTLSSFRFRGVENQPKTSPKTASSSNWAARAVWEAPGVDF